MDDCFLPRFFSDFVYLLYSYSLSCILCLFLKDVRVRTQLSIPRVTHTPPHLLLYTPYDLVYSGLASIKSLISCLNKVHLCLSRPHYGTSAIITYTLSIETQDWDLPVGRYHIKYLFITFYLKYNSLK